MSLVPFRKTDVPAFTSGFGDLDRVFENFFGNAMANLATRGVPSAELSLRMDVSETDKAYIVKADMPGVEEKDLEVTLEEGLLTIKGEKRSEKEEQGRTFHRIERSYGSFSRVLALPADADENAISAHVRNGVLNVEIGKAKEVKTPAKKIAVQVK